MRIPDSFLDELRARVKVSEVIGKRMKLRKAGKDFVCVDDPSFTVSDAKGIFHDFGKTGKSGDIFEFVMWQTGATFEQAVRDIASIAGLPLPGEHGNATGAPRRSAQATGGSDHPNAPGNGAGASSGPRNITKTYDYCDKDGSLLYQVCRIEFVDGRGRRTKTFMQRRPAPSGLTGWVWGLSGGEFIQGRNGDWYAATEERREKWHGAAVRSFPDAVSHSLYRLPELADEREQGDDARTIWIVEGEKDSDTLAGWQMLGVTNSGGARHWTADHAEMFRGLDVIILLDNDPAGRERGHLIGASLRNIAKRTRVLDWREHWPNCPEKADVTDWRDLNGGNADKLFAIADKLPTWTPVRPESKFLAIPFSEIEKPSREFEWLIKKVLTRGETSMWFGPPGCGKSFLLTDAALAVARGTDWMGYKARRGLVIYQAGEGGLGLKKRLRAYRNEHGIKLDESLPFVLLPSPINLFNGEDDVNKLIAEIKLWQAFFDIPLELVVIDTFSAAAAGADENQSKDVGPVMARCRRVAMECNAHVAIVHHTPKGGGSPRGWSGFTGNVENVIEVIRTENIDTEYTGGRSIGRDVREFVVRKQKDGEDGFGQKFVLKQVVLGRDADDELVTSCVVSPLVQQSSAHDTGREVPKGYADLQPNARALMRSLATTLQRHGRLPPAELNVKSPPGVMCVTVGEWQAVRRETLYAGHDPDDPDGKKFKNKIKKQIERTYEDGRWTERENLIGKDGEWIWRTDRKVFGIDPPPVDVHVPQSMLLAPDEDPADIADLISHMGGFESSRD